VADDNPDLREALEAAARSPASASARAPHSHPLVQPQDEGRRCENRAHGEHDVAGHVQHYARLATRETNGASSRCTNPGDHGMCAA
jgi:hypothetical protein